MAGMGPAPKPASQRRRRNAPTHQGVTLPTTRAGAVPKMPAPQSILGADGKIIKVPYCQDAKEAWKRWWRDGVATQWSDADFTALTRAIRLFNEWAMGGRRQGLDSELRLTLDGLGLTPKGRLQLRWRYADDGELDAPGTVTSIRAARSARARADDDPR